VERDPGVQCVCCVDDVYGDEGRVYGCGRGAAAGAGEQEAGEDGEEGGSEGGVSVKKNTEDVG
jgi:hypothetical protein